MEAEEKKRPKHVQESIDEELNHDRPPGRGRKLIENQKRGPGRENEQPRPNRANHVPRRRERRQIDAPIPRHPRRRHPTPRPSRHQNHPRNYQVVRFH